MHETSPLLDNRTKAPVSAQLPAKEQRPLFKRSHLIGFIIVNITLLCLVYSIVKYQDLNNADMLGAAWSSKAAPLSITDPATLGIQPAYRPGDSQPGPAFRTLINRGIPLPTNSWYENLLIGPDNTVPESNVFQVPYILDTSGSIVGVRTHPSHVQASSKIVMVGMMNGVCV
ncbi:hypothetical protein EON64_13175 [archaeon]|nr:MAG: hypothetical protein EON64_13175 [archaeon]